jgi:hypothetical protein
MANWLEQHNRREFFDQLGKDLALQRLDDFLNITNEMIKEHGGRALFENVYSNSITAALQDAYPNHLWIRNSVSRSLGKARGMNL